MHKNKSLTLINIFFSVIGIVIMSIGIIWIGYVMYFASNADEVEGLITELTRYKTYDSDGEVEYEYDIYVEYTYEGYEHEVELDIYSSNMKEGRTVTLWVNRDDPRDVIVKNTDFLFGLIPLGIGLAFALVGIVPIIAGRVKNRKTQNLKENGKRLTATIDEIIVNYNFSVNDEHPYRIICSYKDINTGTIYRFKSANIWQDPYLVCDEGDNIDVWVNEKDYSKYFVDVDGLAQIKIVDYT